MVAAHFSALAMVLLPVASLHAGGPATALHIANTGTNTEGLLTFRLDWVASSNATYLVQSATSLAAGATWTTLEQDGMLFVWNDPERKPPSPEATIPRIEGASSAEWTDWHWYTTVVGSNCREIIDNVVDMAHFFYIHGSLPTYFKNIFEGHVATQYMNGEGRPDMGGTEGAQMLGNTSVASYYDPSFMIDDLTYHYEHGDAQSVLINCHYPIDANSFVLQYGIIVKKSEALPGDDAKRTAIQLGDYVKLGFEQDVEIWRHKARIDNPLLVEEDGPVYQLRRWYQQFYVDTANVEPDMVDRFEFELEPSERRKLLEGLDQVTVTLDC